MHWWLMSTHIPLHNAELFDSPRFGACLGGEYRRGLYLHKPFRPNHRTAHSFASRYTCRPGGSLYHQHRWNNPHARPLRIKGVYVKVVPFLLEADAGFFLGGGNLGLQAEKVWSRGQLWPNVMPQYFHGGGSYSGGKVNYTLWSLWSKGGVFGPPRVHTWLQGIYSVYRPMCIYVCVFPVRWVWCLCAVWCGCVGVGVLYLLSYSQGPKYKNENTIEQDPRLRLSHGGRVGKRDYCVIIVLVVNK